MVVALIQELFGGVLQDGLVQGVQPQEVIGVNACWRLILRIEELLALLGLVIGDRIQQLVLLHDLIGQLQLHLLPQHLN